MKSYKQLKYHLCRMAGFGVVRYAMFVCVIYKQHKQSIRKAPCLGPLQL